MEQTTGCVHRVAGVRSSAFAAVRFCALRVAVIASGATHGLGMRSCAATCEMLGFHAQNGKTRCAQACSDSKTTRPVSGKTHEASDR